MSPIITTFEKECIFIPPNITLEGIKNMSPKLKSVPRKKRSELWWKLEYIRNKNTTHKNLKWWQEEFIINKLKLA